MQQSVLLTATRGPDGLHKNHIVKRILRWYRRCILLDAFSGQALTSPYEAPNGASFTGPLYHHENLDDILDAYLTAADEIPHHFQLHFMHAAEILGYKHPDPGISLWWKQAYFRIVNDAHLNPESPEQMERRLSDNENTWREAEEVTADGIGGGNAGE